MLNNINFFSNQILEKNVEHKFLLFSYPFYIILRMLNLTLKEALISIMLFHLTTINWVINQKNFYVKNVYETNIIILTMMLIYFIYSSLFRIFSLKEKMNKYRIPFLFLERIFLLFWLLRFDNYVFYDYRSKFLYLYYKNIGTEFGLILCINCRL